MTHDVFDSDRTAEHVQAMQGERFTVADYGILPLRIDDTGTTVHAPLRMVWTDHLGVALELGPYSISSEDAAQLSEVLARYATQLRGAPTLP